MRHLIFGAAGFIGSALAHHLAARGADVLALDRERRPESSTPFRTATLDVLRDLTDPADTTFLAPADVAWYLAHSPAYRGFPARAGHLFAVNAAGALHAAELAAAAGCRLFVNASSGSVYAPAMTPRAEHDPLAETDAYALSKITAERALGIFAAARPAMRVLSLRLFGVYGPGQRAMLVPGLIARLTSGQPVTLAPGPLGRPDDGFALSLTYIDDLLACLDAVADAALAGRITAPVINVASPITTSIRHLADAIGLELGVTPRYEPAPAPRAGDLLADLNALRRVLEPPATPLHTALRRMVHADAAGAPARLAAGPTR